jgi:integrase
LAFARICSSKPLPHIRLHDLRHVHATTLLLAGEPVHVVAARLGHADPSITLKGYAHVVMATLIVGLAVAAPRSPTSTRITVARFDDPVGTETLVLRLECP